MKKRLLALSAAIFVAAVSCPLAFADTWDTSLEPGTVSSTDPEETNYVNFAQVSSSENEIGSTIMLGGIALMAVGGIGIVSLIVWQIVSRRRDRAEEAREDIFDEIQQAEALSRKRRAAEQAERRDRRVEEDDEYGPYDRRTPQRAPERPSRRYDPYAVTGEVPLVPDSAEYTVERPIVPTTPVSMQPKTPAPRHIAPDVSAQPAAVHKPAQPAAQPAKAPAAKPVQAPAAVQPAKPAPARKFDLDDILREVREEKESN